MNKIKDIGRRGSILLVAAAFLGSWLSTLPVVAFADDFNTSEFANRILLLSSSSPGWSYTDGAGNLTYAQPGSGPNGKQTAEQFNITTNSDNTTNNILSFTFQYCTAAAGTCRAPGDDGYTGSIPAGPEAAAADNTDAMATATPPTAGCMTDPTDNGTCVRNGDSTTSSDLNVTFASASEAANTTVGASCTAGILVRSDTGQMCGQPSPTATGGNFIVLQETGTAPANWVYSGGWTASTTNNEDGNAPASGLATGRNNYIKLTGGNINTPAATPLEIIFFATNSNYITNPGSDAFFVKMADYSGATPVPSGAGENLMDGGVTVANVMSQSIEITTKVLETMSFSVGVEDPDTQSGEPSYGGCDTLSTTNTDIPNAPANGIALGDSSLEYSLSTAKAFDAYSLWRLSTNSANGGTIYYSGDTLRSTEGSSIDAITSPSIPVPGTNQFGLGLVDTSNLTGTANQMTESGGVVTYPGITSYYDSHHLASGYITNYDAHQSGDDIWKLPSLSVMAPETGYGAAAGALASAQFDYSNTANTSPVPIAYNSDSVIQCATGEVRYVADIAGYTPAGIYTTKVNFLAAPEY